MSFPLHFPSPKPGNLSALSAGEDMEEKKPVRILEMLFLKVLYKDGVMIGRLMDAGGINSIFFHGWGTINKLPNFAT